MSHRVSLAESSGLLLYSCNSQPETAPVRFLEIDREGASVAVSARPRLGESVSLCLLEPTLTNWIPSTVVGFALNGESPCHVELAFRTPLTADVMSAIRSHQQPPSGSTPVADPPDKSRRILVVDDDEQTRGALALLLRRRGYEVVTAGTVAEGLAYLDPAPCGILLDLTLPDGPGEAILLQVRKSGLLSRVAVCTGTHDLHRLEQVEHLRPQALLQKPVKLNDVIQACAAMVS